MLYQLLVSILFVRHLFAGYYSINRAPYSQNRSEYFCNDKGKHLASIQTKSQNDITKTMCQEFDNKCWLGLQIKLDKNTNSTVMRWIDGTLIEASMITPYLCEDLEEMINYNDDNINGIIYNSYIDTVDNCWRLTANSSLQICGICGPQMFDPTGCYWICNAIIPSILAVIFIIYSIYSFIFLTYHLCIFEHNYLEKKLHPTILIKITALMIPSIIAVTLTLFCTYYIMSYIAYNRKHLLPPTSMIDSAYPYIYTQSGYIGITAFCLFAIYLPLSYVHVSLRLKHAFNNNSIMKSIIPFRYCYSSIIILIILYSLIPLIYVIVTSAMSSTNNNSWKISIAMSSINNFAIEMTLLSIFLMTDITINFILLYLYVKGLHKFSREHYFRRDEVEKYANYNVKNQRQHELMLEATRYSVLFLVVLIFNILGICVTVSTYFYSAYYRSKKEFPYAPVPADYIRNSILILFWFCKEVSLLIAIQLSFIFSHKQYELLCKKCDKRVKNYCHGIVDRENSKIVKEFELKQEICNRNLKQFQQPLLG